MNFDQLITHLRELDRSLRERAVKVVNIGLTARNWLMGAYLVEFEQGGEDRAEYGESLIPTVAKRLAIRGLPPTTLRLCRTLYLAYPEIRQTLSGEMGKGLMMSQLGIQQTLSVVSEKGTPQTSAESTRPGFAPPVGQLLEQLTFSHFVELLRIEDPLQRAFYEVECVKCGWSVRELKRQIGSLLFERLGLSTNKEKLLRLTAAEVTPSLPADIIKDPYIFEFLGLKPKEVFRENDLETALLDHLQEFLLELGNGFCSTPRPRSPNRPTSTFSMISRTPSTTRNYIVRKISKNSTNSSSTARTLKSSTRSLTKRWSALT